MNGRMLAAITFGLTFAFSSGAQAHIDLSFPTSSTTDQKGPSPCGTKGARKPNTFKPGETIVVKWVETIGHPGHFRIAFDTDGMDDLKDPTSYTDIKTPAVSPILADNVLPHTTNANNVAREYSITFPNIVCNNCTLQLLQMMTDKPPFGPGGGGDFYYRCADIVLAGTPSGTDAGADGSADAITNSDATGSAGTTGGTNGVAGTTGTAGIDGAAGTNGAAGSTGTAGSTATGGTTGSAGSTGTAGTMPSGAAGTGNGGGGCSVGGTRPLAETLLLCPFVVGMWLVLGRRRVRSRPSKGGGVG